jgi:O-acetyl-ADP-ribose deacetylase (regulator of RNase III)
MGTDGTIHTKGGPRIYEECRQIGGCPIGDAVITSVIGSNVMRQRKPPEMKARPA